MNAPSLPWNSAQSLRHKHTGLHRPYTLDPTPVLERQAQQESNARSYPRRIPLVLEKAHGIYVQDSRGQVFIDCLAGAGTLALGHNHPVVVDAIRSVLDDGLPLHTLDITTPVKDAFVQELFDCLPPAFARKAKIQFCGPSGADAVEAAMKLTRTATGRHTVLAFQGAYHGMTMGTLSVSGNLQPKAQLGALLPGVHMLPFPQDYRCPFGLRGEDSLNSHLHYLEHLLTDPESGVSAPAAMLLEPIQGEGGVLPAAVPWLQGVRRITRQMGIPLVLDEIQSGIARTGRMFAFDHADIVPDVLTLSKAIGGGLPLAVVIYSEDLDRWEAGAHAGTFRGNQLAMAAGTATLRLIKQEHLADHAASMGEFLLQRLRELASLYPWIADVRGKGLMLGLEIIASDGSTDSLGRPRQDSARARRFQNACLKHGLILELGGRFGATVRLLPPLIVQEQEIDLIIDIMHRAAAASGE